MRTREPPGKHTFKLLLAPIIFLVICSNLAGVVWVDWQRDHPLGLIALSSINRYLILVADDLDAVSYYGVGTLRLLVSDPLFFLMGYWYGERALAWMDRRAPNYGPALRQFQGVFGKAAWPLIAIAPNNFICLFAGAAGMRVSLFFAVNVAGTVARLYLIRLAGEQFDSPIDAFQGFVAEYRIPFLVGSVLLVGWTLRKEFSGGGEIDSLREMADAIDDDDAPPPVAGALAAATTVAAGGTPDTDVEASSPTDLGAAVSAIAATPFEPTTRRASSHPSLTTPTRAETADFFDDAALAELRAYTGPAKKVALAAKVVTGLVTVLVVFGLDLGPRFADLVGESTAWPLQLLGVALGFGVIQAVVSLPFDWWSTMVHDRRFGVANQSPGLWAADQVKGFVLGTVLSAAILVPVYWAIRTFDSWWLAGGLIFFGIALVFNFVYPVWIMPRFNKFTPMPEGVLRTRIEQIAALADTSIEGVYTMDGSKRSRRGNAFVAGFGPTKRVVVFDTILDWPLDHISQVVAHEIGHYRLNHIPKTFPFAGLQMLATLAFVQFIAGNETLLGWAGVTELGDPGALGVFEIGFLVPNAVLGLASSWLSRRNEREADLEALELLGDPTSFVAMWPDFVKLNLADLEPSRWERLNHSHPHVSERMQFGLDWAEMNDVPVERPTKASVPSAAEVAAATATARPGA